MQEKQGSGSCSYSLREMPMNLERGRRNLEDSLSASSARQSPDGAASPGLRQRKKLRDPKFITFSSLLKPAERNANESV